jgi:hypothetical protein
LEAQGFRAANITFSTIQGTIQLTQYAAWVDRAPQVRAGAITQPAENDPGLGGAVIGLHYTPAPRSTDPAAADVHWIQVVRTNAPLAAEQRYGSNRGGGIYYFIDDLTDNQNTAPTNPFYDNVHSAEGPDFIDNPARGFVRGLDGNEITFQAQVFLATGTIAANPRDTTLRIYDGVWWGFHNSIVPSPEPSTFLLAGVGSAVLLVIGRRRA